jgi:pilus assembly protein CpaB
MKSKSVLIAIGAALLIGIFAVIMASLFIKPSPTKNQQLRVIQAAVDIAPGKYINIADLAVVPWPEDTIPPGAIVDLNSLINRSVRTNIPKGQVIVEQMLMPVVTGSNLAMDIPPGKRAFTIANNEVAGVGGFASPGNYVDVILSSHDSKGSPISKIVVKHVRVLAIAQQRSFEDANPKLGSTITLEVTPEEAQRLDLARSMGSLSLALRNRDDNADVDTKVSGKGELRLNSSDESFDNVTGNSIQITRGNLGGAASVQTESSGINMPPPNPVAEFNK